MKEHPTAWVIGILQTLPLGHKPLQRGPQGRIIVLTVIEAAMDIGLTPRDQSATSLLSINQKTPTSGIEAMRELLTAKLRAWAASICRMADMFPRRWVSQQPV